MLNHRINIPGISSIFFIRLIRYICLTNITTMKLLKKTFLIILILLIVIFIAVLGYIQTTKPKYEGEEDIANISRPTTVYFDEYGVPHIYAETQKDAMTTLGYVHAQDRLWQMELMRRIAPGRLSEIFGNPVLKTDKFLRELVSMKTRRKPLLILIRILKPIFWQPHI